MGNDPSHLDHEVLVADLRVQCIAAGRDRSRRVGALLQTGAEGADAMRGWLDAAQQQAAKAGASELQCRQEAAGVQGPHLCIAELLDGALGVPTPPPTNDRC